jgi:hypothetical protein
VGQAGRAGRAGVSRALPGHRGFLGQPSTQEDLVRVSHLFFLLFFFHRFVFRFKNTYLLNGRSK